MRMKDIELLLESQKTQYMGMMPKAILDFFPSTKEIWLDTVNNAVSILKRQDRIVWYLRLSKGALLENKLSCGKDTIDNDEIHALIKKEFDKIQRVYPSMKFYRLYASEILLKLEHFLSLPFPKIQNFIFDKQDPDEIIGWFSLWEKEWQKGLDQNIDRKEVSDKQEVIIEFPNGWQWVNLHKNSCDIESRAMGHCGNRGSTNPDEEILSLREPSKRGWIPHCTFIYDKKYKSLGEMKGRGNDKPSPKYHFYIVSLLKLPMIQNLFYGGYKNENNFQLSDLSLSDQKALVELKPNFSDITFIYNTKGFTKQVSDAVYKFLQKNSVYHYVENNTYGFLKNSGEINNKSSFLRQCFGHHMTKLWTDITDDYLYISSEKANSEKAAKDRAKSFIVAFCKIINSNIGKFELSSDIVFRMKEEIKPEPLEYFYTWTPEYILDEKAMVYLVNLSMQEDGFSYAEKIEEYWDKKLGDK